MKKTVKSKNIYFRLVKLFLIGAIVCGFTVAFVSSFEEVSCVLSRASLPLLCLAFLLACIYQILNASGWTLVVRGLGYRFDYIAGVRLWLLSESCKWLPGSIWGYVSRVYLAKKEGVPNNVASLSLPIELVLTVVAWSITALIGIVSSGIFRQWSTIVKQYGVQVALGSVSLTALLILALGNRKTRQHIGIQLRKLAKRCSDISETELNLSSFMQVTILYTVLCFYNGVIFAILLSAITSTPSIWAVIGINAVAWLVGFFSFFAPGGIGVREASIAAMLATIIPLEEALAAAVLWRFIQLCVEIVCLPVCLMARRAVAPISRVDISANAMPGRLM